MKDWQLGDLVQIDPSHDSTFAGCVLIVSEVRPWGALGFVRVPHKGGGADAPYRLPWEGGEKVGAAVWINGVLDDS